jgi:hypothetical protein
LSTSAFAGPAPASVDEQSVFLNVPYDRQYGPLFVALIAGLVTLGRIPRCALEAQSQGQMRVQQIYGLLESCGSSIHDLSRVNLSGSQRVPRFNMPFELGIAFGLAQSRGHRIFVFETKAYRLQASLSDMNAFDPQIHGGTRDGILFRILDCFERPAGPPRPEQLRSVARRVSLAAAQAQGEQGIDDPFRLYIFKRLVAAALETAVAEGLITP